MTRCECRMMHATSERFPLELVDVSMKSVPAQGGRRVGCQLSIDRGASELPTCNIMWQSNFLKAGAFCKPAPVKVVSNLSTCPLYQLSQRAGEGIDQKG